MKSELMLVLKNVEILKDLYEFTVFGSIAKEAKAGQYINITMTNREVLLTNPLIISRVNGEALTFYYKKEGSDNTVLSKIKTGTYVNVTGVHGNGFPFVENKKVLLIGDELGIPPLGELAKVLKHFKDCDVELLLGYKTKEEVYFNIILSQFGKIHITTIDGTEGFKGKPMDYIKEKNLEFDLFYACGSYDLIKTLDEEFKGEKEGYIVFEKMTDDAPGECCGGDVRCLNEFGVEIKKCKEGPVFKLGEIIYN